MTRKTPKSKAPAKIARKTAAKPRLPKKVSKVTRKATKKRTSKPRSIADVNRDQGLEMEQALGPVKGAAKHLSNAQKATQQILAFDRKPAKLVVEVRTNRTCRLGEAIAKAESAMETSPIVGISLADKLKAKSVQHEDNAPHLIIEARAGTGKTTTLIEGLKRVMGLETSLVPSPQQAAVWEAMEQSKGVRTVCFAAFNKSIAAELKNRVPPGCDAMTMHGMGYRALRNAFPKLGAPNSYRVQDIICELLEEDIRVLRMKKPTLLKATEELVGLCKMNLVGHDIAAYDRYDNWDAGWIEELRNLASHYDIELNGQSEEVFALVPRVLGRCKEVAKDNCIDFNDMVWLPIVLQLPVFKYDLLLIDEMQDLNRAQQGLTKRAGKRLIYCGDPLQAIYGFAGADSQSMSRLEGELKQTERGCLHLPLTVTRRCGKAIVREAQKYVPDFEAFPTNPEGKISYAKYKNEGAGSYHTMVEDGNMVLCRCNAPLVSECFKFIRQGRKANIQGRDIGAGLVKTVKKILGVKDDGSLECYSAVQLIMGVDTWLHEESKRENAKRNPDESKLIALQDRHDCLMAFTDGQQTAAQVVAKIEAMFTDDKSSQGIKLSSIHRAKGLESKRVFILVPKEAPLPHPMAKTAWQRAEESHLAYVGITRAIEELIWVS